MAEHARPTVGQASRLPAARRAAHSIRLASWCIALACLFLKVVTAFDPFPYWGSDPTRVIIPVSSLTPAPSMLLDVAAIVACGVALLAEVMAGAPLNRLLSLLWLAGTAGVAAHATVFHGQTLDDARLGLSWAAALCAGLTAHHVCRDPSLRRITLATGVSITGALIAKGVLQFFIEQPDTIAAYRRDSAAFLAAQGWTPGSAAARAFERRLSQPEASGWFGMANVYASFMAAGLTAMLGWAVLAWKQTREKELPSGWSGLLSLGTVLCAAGVWMAGSKGGVAACLVGMGLLGAGATALRIIPSAGSTRVAGLGGPLAVALLALALAAIVIRGLIGEPLNRFDLSLLFRWHYMQAALKIAAAHPLFGAGPAGFKDAYILAKPPISPEEVASPHSVLLDYTSTLGVFGLAWALLLLSLIWGAGARLTARALQTPQGQPPTTPKRLELWAVALLVFIPSLAGAWVERTLASPDLAIARVGSILAWLGLAAASLSLMRTRVRWRWIAAAGALAMAVHGQIEMTGTWHGAAGLFMLVLGAAAAPDTDLFSERRRSDAAWPLLMILSAAVSVPFVLKPAFRWEGALAHSADAVQPSAEINTRLTELLGNPNSTPADFDQVAVQLGHLTNTPPPTDPAAFELAAATLLIRTAAGAQPGLETAAARFPAHFPTTEALVRLLLARASAEQRMGKTADADQSIERATHVATAAAARFPSASAAGLMGNTHFAAAQLLGTPERLKHAAEAWEQAARLDPHGPTFALKALETYTLIGDASKARSWAQEALRRDELQRLDPLRRLTEDERKRVNAALAAP
jgi:hypothetical protein